MAGLALATRPAFTAGPHRVRRGEEQIGFGGAALTSSMAAQIKVCSPFRLLRARSLWIVGFVLSLASALPSAAASPRGLADILARSSNSLDSANPGNVKS